MTFKKAGIILSLIFSLLPTQKIFAQTFNTGFVSENIWYSKDPFEERDKIKIYTFIFNSNSRELSGTVIFFDKIVLLGKKDFIIAPKRAEDVSIDWTVTAGDHNIFGKIENARFLISPGKYEETYLMQNETEKSSRTVSKKIISKTKNISTDANLALVSNVKKIIEEKTPLFITEPVISTTNKLEAFRENANVASNNKKTEVKNEIRALDNAKTAQKDKIAQNPLLKPFKYAELFFLSISSLILNNRLIFYGLLLIFTFFILHFIWKIIF